MAVTQWILILTSIHLKSSNFTRRQLQGSFRWTFLCCYLRQIFCSKKAYIIGQSILRQEFLRTEDLLSKSGIPTVKTYEQYIVLWLRTSKRHLEFYVTKFQNDCGITCLQITILLLGCTSCFHIQYLTLTQ